MIILKNAVSKISPIAVFLMMLCLVSTSFAQEKKYTTNDMPKSVIDAFNKLYPNSTVAEYDIENENGEKHYEVESIQGTLKRTSVFNETGNLIQTEESINTSDLPSNIISAINNSKYPGIKILEAEKITKGSEINYDVLTESNKDKIEFVLNSKGEILSTDKSDNDDGDGEENGENDD